MKYPTFWPQFYTATILEWKPLLKQNKYKDVVIESLRFLVTEKRIKLYAFVIMSNHIHLIWQPLAEFTPDDIQHSLMSFTAHKIKNDLQQNHPQVLSHFKVQAKDRDYQFWERNSLGIDLFTEDVFIQKLNYIHLNPVRAGLCNLPEEYYYSSAKFYECCVDDFGMLTHYKD
jgi:REP element-mobilizing transposase RayT